MNHPLNYIQHKKARKTSAEPISDATRAFVSSLLEVLLEKLRWDGDEDPADLDDDDRAAFEVLRKVCQRAPWGVAYELTRF